MEAAGGRRRRGKRKNQKEIAHRLDPMELGSGGWGDGGAAQLPAEGIEARQPEMARAAVEVACSAWLEQNEEGREGK
jgi:hypothetical protein